MKKTIAFIAAVVILLTMAACSGKTAVGNKTEAQTNDTAQAIASAEAVTAEYIIKATTPAELLKGVKQFSVSVSFSNTGDEELEGAKICDTFAISENGSCEVNDVITYSDGVAVNTFFSNDPADSNYYMLYDGEPYSDSLEDGYAEEYFGCSLLGYTSDGISLKSVKEENGYYIAEVENGTVTLDTVTIDSKTGRVTGVVSTYDSVKGEGTTTTEFIFEYSNTVSIDRSAKTANSKSENNSTADGTAGLFDTTDIEGNPVTDEILSGAKLVMLNFWEPWCGPCVGEMPDLQALYEKYQAEGLLIIGVYSTFSQDEEAKELLEEMSITYPILRCSSSLAALQQDYVPATYFLSGEGKLLTEKPFAGARSFEDWEVLITEYLNR